MDIQYHFVMDELTPTQWITKCAERLHERWQTVETAQLEEVAVEIWQNRNLRAMEPAEAASSWLKPISGSLSTDHGQATGGN